MEKTRDFLIDSVIRENNKIKGFAVYPLYGEINFRSIRMIMKEFCLNSFMTKAENLYLHAPVGTDSEFYKITIEEINDEGIPIFKKIDHDKIQKIFESLPDYFALPGDAT